MRNVLLGMESQPVMWVLRNEDGTINSIESGGGDRIEGAKRLYMEDKITVEELEQIQEAFLRDELTTYLP